ncbi:MAG: DnaA regulatory inactivator Hda [Gammaproteobacteria bacterium]|nr:MAG: DnaA regulatory inactivator Hda [Gammaproteobacteria bacterium]
MYTQLALDLQLRESHTFDNFISGDNALAMAMLKQMANNDGEQQLYLWGDQFIGKSHLLQATCQLATSLQHSISYLPLSMMLQYPATVLEGLEQIDLVCVDDIQRLQQQIDWQEAMFDLINRMREQQKKLVFASLLPPNELDLQLEDLRSRLNWGPVIQLKPLDDSGKKQALQMRAQMRGFELPEAVAVFMLNNYSRDLNGLFDKLEQLDRASLMQQKRLTIPFVKQVCES